MTPTDFRPPVSTSAQSSYPDPNPNPLGADSHNLKLDAGFDCFFSMPKQGPDFPRRKPRLVKMRKQSAVNRKRDSQGTTASINNSGHLNTALNQGNRVSFGNFDLVFGAASKSDFALNLNKENGESFENVERMECPNSEGLVFGASKNYSAPTPKFGFVSGGDDTSSSKFNSKSKNEDQTNNNSLASLSNKEPASSENNSNARRSNLEFGQSKCSSYVGQPHVDEVNNFDNASSSFIENGFVSASDSMLQHINSEPSGMFQFGKVANGSVLHSDRLKADFVFGATRPTFDLGNVRNGECNRDEADRVVEPQGLKLNSTFGFSCGVKGKNKANESNKLAEDLEYFNREKTKNHNGFWSAQNSNLGKFKFGSSSRNVADSNLPKPPIYELFDEMNSLNIGHSMLVNDSEKTIHLNEKSHVNIKNVFVFGSNQNISTESSACDQPKVVNAKDPYINYGVDRADTSCCGPNADRSSASEIDENFASSLKGSKDKEMPREMVHTNGSGLSNEHSFSFSAGTSGKENQPINYDSTTACWSQSLQSNLNSDTERDKTPFPVFTQEGFGSHDEVDAPEAHSGHQFEKKEEFSFPRTPFAPGKPFSEFNASTSNKSFCFTANSFSRVNEKLDCRVSCRLRDKKVKKKNSLRQRTLVQRLAGQTDLSGESSSKHNSDSPGCCSPMYFSPCLDTNSSTSADNTTGATETKEDVVDSKEAHVFNAFEKKYGEGNDNFSETYFRKDPDGHRVFSSDTSPSAQDGLSSIRRQYRKKYKLKVESGSNNINHGKIDFSSDTVQHSSFGRNRSAGGRNGVASHVRNKDIHASKANEVHGNLGLSYREACEQWRIRGNQSYKAGNLSQAEDFYTKGIKTVSARENSGCCIEPLLLCYSNRAATRMSLRRMREAISDCASAAALDPQFLKVKLRAANCYLILGEVEEAVQHYNNCLESKINLCLDRRIIIEAADGLQKAQKVSELMHRCTELLQQRTLDAPTNALGLTAEALSISCYSEKLLAMKGEALCMLQMYNEVIKLCESTLDIAEKNISSDSANLDDFNCKSSSLRLWRWHLMSRSYFHLGKFELALDLIEKQEQMISVSKRCGNMTQESSPPLAGTIRELLHRKKAGNEAFKSGKYPEAIEHYTAAISSCVESHPFAAICFCNRAAAHQALGQLVDAIADCSVAIALDKKYTKAVSRRATLHEMIRDYEHAVNDIERLISLQETQSQERTTQSEVQYKSNGSSAKEAKRTRRQLSSILEKAKGGTPLDLYLILGIKSSDSESDIKKAYRKAALRHHPDKAGQMLAKSDAVDDGLWKEISETVREDADRLFKLIGEAYAVLSDSNKRSKYDLEEELRDVDRGSTTCSDYCRQSDSYSSPSGRTNWSRRRSNFYSSPFGSGNTRRYGQEYWRTYGESHP